MGFVAAADDQQDVGLTMSPMLLVIAPDPSVAARPATLLACQRRAQ
jgi:hypothetical protein